MLPNFLVVGAAKCGTTSLFHYLNQHPEVFIPEKKECFFFSQLDHFNGPRNDQEINSAIVRSVNDYEALFDAATGQSLRGDVSHDYLYYYERAIQNILKYLGQDVPIVIILRDPRKRAYSHFKHHIKAGATKDNSFEQALGKEAERIQRGWSWNWHYVTLGLYADQVQAYLKAFNNVRVYLFDELLTDTPGLIRNLYEFIGADPDFNPEIRVQNAGVNIHSNRLNRFIRNESSAKEIAKSLLTAVGLSPEQISQMKRKVMIANTGTKDDIDAATLERLTEVFEPDIIHLEKLIGSDLSSWRQ